MSVPQSMSVLCCVMVLGLLGVAQGAGGAEAASGAAAAGAEAPAKPDISLATLRKEHPRLLATSADFDRIKQLVHDDATAQAWLASLQKQAARMMQQPPVRHELIGPRLLDKSRTALNRISTLAGLYRITGDASARQRAIDEMEAVAAFPDWNPSHFLDVAEMSTAMAVGYDWLFDSLTPQQRQHFAGALVRLGLQEGAKAYGYDVGGGGGGGAGGGRKLGWWVQVNHNWNQVCNGGMLIGALALADEQPELAQQILHGAVTNLPRAMRSFAPDGGWAEGPGYWNYATHYNVYALAALDTALGTDFGLSQASGFAETGLFRMRFIGPAGQTFNYADAGAGADDAPQMLWMGRRFGHAEYIAHERSRVRQPSIFHLLWYDKAGAWPDASVAASALYKGVDVAFLASPWSQQQRPRLWLGIKGGDNRANHSHLDLGTFCLDWADARFAMQLGGDDYNLPDYFGKRRWTYYRLMTVGQNTLTIDGQNQKTDATAHIVSFDATGQGGNCSIDLRAAYPDKLTSWKRSAQMELAPAPTPASAAGDGAGAGAGTSAGAGLPRLVLRDSVQAKTPVSIVWAMHTPATVQLSDDGRTATLTSGARKMRLTLSLPKDARFGSAPVTLAPPQRPLKGVTKLSVELTAVQQTEIAVEFQPLED